MSSPNSAQDVPLCVCVRFPFSVNTASYYKVQTISGSPNLQLDWKNNGMPFPWLASENIFLPGKALVKLEQLVQVIILLLLFPVLFFSFASCFRTSNLPFSSKSLSGGERSHEKHPYVTPSQAKATLQLCKRSISEFCIIFIFFPLVNWNGFSKSEVIYTK